MYDALIPIAQDLSALDATLAAPDGAQRVARIAAAFDETARRISQATQTAADDGERLDLQKLYRGMVAARRIVLSIQERHGASA
ncbi:type III secretion system protein [Paraburkholderia sp. Ac-20336]|uniref:type III secretion system protein n=1 Tax=Burkholderiaceae TaxID=119060 RepID=UPI00142413A0|nr:MULTISPECIES: type III secretion system protein [Burkholderiaceae]MBN3807413.1 type III secretion system protein [Paraburkholderia sp. Ac-20336]MBN3851620.1 type III secretion system protein [Paraburkholderia sp. Ac-20342]NIF54071.1 type III secretion system protein [Burkholderia sp. Ax-1724]NIF81724.1 type III secretion system protein [Paraburkholderia sp. Cy-641]